MHPSYYYFGAPDSDSADDTYDLTRKCFNIDGASASDSKDEAVVEGRNTPPQVELPAERDEAHFLTNKECSLSKSTSCRIGSTRNGKTYVYFSELSSKSA
jgi:hypothetical protein